MKKNTDKELICTVLLVTYNHRDTIRKAIESVLEQKTTYKFVIKIFDDASSDGTSEIVKEYAKKYPDLIEAHTAPKNQGAELNIWTAYKSVTTKYFILLECDDYWCDEQKLQLQIDALEANPTCTFCAHNTIANTIDDSCREYKEGSLWIQRAFFKVKHIIHYRDIEPIDIGGYIPHISARMIRTESLNIDKIQYKQTILFDFNEYYYLLCKGPYYYIDKPMTVYQKTGAGIHSGKSPLEVLNQEYPWIVQFNIETNYIIADKIFREYQLQTDHRLALYYDMKYKTGYRKKLEEEQQKATEKDTAIVEYNDNPEILYCELLQAVGDLESIRHSVSFKVGRVITWIPRKARAVLRSLKQYGIRQTLMRIIEAMMPKRTDKALYLSAENSEKTENSEKEEKKIMDVQVLKHKLEKNRYYFLCNAGIGDTMLVCGLRYALEKKYGAPIHLLIPEHHEFLMEMYDIADYTVVKWKNTEIEDLSDENREPKKGKIFVAHPCAHRELWMFFKPIYEQLSVVKFYPWFLEFLKLDRSTELKLPKHFPKMSSEFKKRCEEIAPLDKIVLLCTEATSMLPLPERFWRNKVSELKKEGFTVISNALEPQGVVSGSQYLKMTLKEAVALAYACNSVYSLRSGFCDAVYARGKDLHVYYPRHSSLYIYNMNDLFNRNDIDEEIILV